MADPLPRECFFRNDSGYYVTSKKGHPVADRRGTLYLHRMVLFDAIGAGAHKCHWCRSPIEWGKTGPERLVVDHLDGDKANNEVSNLVPSCFRCNTARGTVMSWISKHRDEPIILALIQDALAGRYAA